MIVAVVYNNYYYDSVQSMYKTNGFRITIKYRLVDFGIIKRFCHNILFHTIGHANNMKTTKKVMPSCFTVNQIPQHRTNTRYRRAKPVIISTPAVLE